MIFDQLACIPLVSGNYDYLEQGFEYGKEAYRLFPESPTLRGTYGALLVEIGDHKEANKLLLPLTTDENTQIDKTISRCMLAKLNYEDGNYQAGAEWLTKAQESGG